jgi:hypothetical protein
VDMSDFDSGENGLRPYSIEINDTLNSWKVPHDDYGDYVEETRSNIRLAKIMLKRMMHITPPSCWSWRSQASLAKLHKRRKTTFL